MLCPGTRILVEYGMARRHRRRPFPLLPLTAALALLAVLIGAGLLLQNVASDPFRAMQPLEADVYLENANSLRGNRYRMTGTIEHALAWSADQGRLFSVRVEDGGRRLLGVIIPAELSHLNIQRGQRYNFSVEVGERGMLYVKELSKT